MKRRTIALVMDYARGEYQSELRFGVERAAEAHGVDVVIALGEELGGPGTGTKAQNSIAGLIGADVADGVVVASATLGNHTGVESLVDFCRTFAPLPVCSIGVALAGIPSIVVDDGRAIELAVGHLLGEHGCRRVAYIGGRTTHAEEKLRADAYRRTLEAHAIPYDERLVAMGELTIESGHVAMRELMSRGVELDAVVAANDDMALGAIDLLKAHGVEIPRDVLVCGVDDVDVARYTKPSLTSVRQPIKHVAALAVETVLRLLDGEAVPLREAQPLELIRRESCGCARQVITRSARAEAPARDGSLSGALSSAEERQELARALHQAVSMPAAVLRGWPEELLSALDEELAGGEGRFLGALKHVLDRAGDERCFLDQFQLVITLLRARYRWRPGGARSSKPLEQLWHAARLLIGRASVRAEGRQRLSVEIAANDLSWTGRWLTTCLSLPLLKRTLASELDRLYFTRASLSLYEDARRATLKPFFLMENGRELSPPPESFPARLLAPPGFLKSSERGSVTVMPITFGGAEHYGVLVLGDGPNEAVCDAVRVQIGSAMKTAALHREIVCQVELRERLEQEAVRRELQVASHIQTTLAPPLSQIEGLELSAIMNPAPEVGGDYYDVFATSDGGWLAIGDVAGHGLAAGLILLMIHSMVSALTQGEPAASPRDILSTLNAAVHENIRNRLRRDQHAALLLLRYERSGRVTYAGAHEDIVVCRARTRRCERIPTSGVRVGAVPAIDAATRDEELVLEDGDLLVLYSDGVTQARDAREELFGLSRLCSIIEAAQDAPAEAIRDQILRGVEAFCPSPDDDVTIAVARYRAPAVLQPALDSANPS
ncbi:SpoIIE family protein phosphatase [Sorangium sp. So ce136]|uniref:SpoIIE family protein phosphatase n=1 Tax=Sorangium sp. So ce136 TaxID=3133284 RepID=UPI003F0B665E